MPEGAVLREPTECDIVAFMAHPDDAELQCGGTLALAVARGLQTEIPGWAAKRRAKEKSG